jgi:hypothetical protein
MTGAAVEVVVGNLCHNAVASGAPGQQLHCGKGEHYQAEYSFHILLCGIDVIAFS